MPSGRGARADATPCGSARRRASHFRPWSKRHSREEQETHERPMSWRRAAILRVSLFERFEGQRADDPSRRRRGLILPGVRTVQKMPAVDEGGRAAAVEVDRALDAELD